MQTFLPHIGFVRMIHAGDVAEPVLIRLAENLGQRKSGEITRVRHTEIERCIRLEHAGGLFENRINMRDVFKDGVAQSAGEVTGRERCARAIGFDEGFVSVVFLRLAHGKPPGIEPDIQFMVERQ